MSDQPGARPEMPEFVARFAQWWAAPDPERPGALLLRAWPTIAKLLGASLRR